MDGEEVGTCRVDTSEDEGCTDVTLVSVGYMNVRMRFKN